MWNLFEVYLEVHLLFSLVLTRVLTHFENGVGGSETPDTTVEPSGGVEGLIQRNPDEERCPLDKPREMLMLSIGLTVCPVVL